MKLWKCPGCDKRHETDDATVVIVCCGKCYFIQRMDYKTKRSEKSVVARRGEGKKR